MKERHWILDGHTPKPAPLMQWGRWMATVDRHVALTKLYNPRAVEQDEALRAAAQAVSDAVDQAAGDPASRLRVLFTPEAFAGAAEPEPVITVSTVFLGLDHSFGEGPPVLFETMVFGGKHNEEQWRYCTWDQAEVGHRQVVALVTKIAAMADLMHTTKGGAVLAMRIFEGSWEVRHRVSDGRDRLVAEGVAQDADGAMLAVREFCAAYDGLAQIDGRQRDGDHPLQAS